MALSRDQKQAQVQELTKKMSSAESIIFTHYIGLSVSEVGELRAKLQEVQSEMKVAKKTLMKLAAAEAGLPELTDEHLPGPISLIFNNGDPFAGAQIAFKFAKDHEQVELVGGIFEGKILTKEEAIALAKMPSRDVLLATFVGMLKSPLNKFAGICSAPLSGFARALSEMADKGGFAEEKAEVKSEKSEEENKEPEAKTVETSGSDVSERNADNAEKTDAPEASTKPEDSKETEEVKDTEDKNTSDSSESSESSDSSKES